MFFKTKFRLGGKQWMSLGKEIMEDFNLFYIFCFQNV